MKRTILILISIFLCLTCARMLEWAPDGTLITHNYSIWGDWSAHFSFISNIMERGMGWISGENPLFAGIPFQYPFLSHVLTAAFAGMTGLNVVHATLYTSLALLLILPFALDRFFHAVGLTKRQSIIGILLFLFLGGVQAFDSSLNPGDPLTNQMDSGSIFTQIVLFELIPQRAFLFGMVIFMWACSSLIKRTQNPSTFEKEGKTGSSKFSRWHFLGFAFIFALLAWVHLHTWIAMGTLLLCAAIMHYPRRNHFLFGITVAVFSLPFIYFLIFRGGASADSKIFSSQWNFWFPGWAQNPNSGKAVAQNMNFFVFWFYNTGIFLPLAVLGKWITWKKSESAKTLFTIGLAGSVLAIIALLFNLQPYFYDNLKVFTYAFLFLTPFAAIGIDSFFVKKNWFFKVIGTGLVIFQCNTAFQEYVFYIEQKHGTVFFSHAEFELAEKFKSLRRSPDSLVVISPKHNHWVPALAGNPVFMGYPGWLWTWGIQYQPREAELNSILSGKSEMAIEALTQKNSIEYIVVHEQDRVDNQPVAMDYFKSHFQPILEQDGWHVFKTASVTHE